MEKQDQLVEALNVDQLTFDQRELLIGYVEWMISIRNARRLTSEDLQTLARYVWHRVNR